jgi:hypothetical protein
MSLNKSKEITKKYPEVEAVFTTFRNSVCGRREDLFLGFAKEDRRPLLFGRSLFLGEYALEKFYSANYLMPRRHPKHECSN